MRARIFQAIAICGLLAAGVLTAWAFVPAKQREPEPPDPQRERAIQWVNWRYKEVCPSGHETEIVMGQMHFHVDMRALALLEIEDFQAVPSGCPAGPIYARQISFDHIWMTEELYAILQRHGLRLNHLDIDRIVSGHYREPTEFLENPDRRTVIEGLGWIDDITGQRPIPNAFGRHYLLQHSSSAPAVAPPAIVMLCNGNPQTTGLRNCETGYRYGDVRIAYKFRQDKQAPHQEKFWPLQPTGPIKEPEGFLAVDANVRAWINEMLHATASAR
jgi:hypothetical protein